MYDIILNDPVYYNKGILDWCIWNVCTSLQELLRKLNRFAWLIFMNREGLSAVQGTWTAKLLILHINILLYWLIIWLFIFSLTNASFVNLSCDSIVFAVLSYFIHLFSLLIHVLALHVLSQVYHKLVPKLSGACYAVRSLLHISNTDTLKSIYFAYK
jgi:hypothetical protein